MGYVYKSKLLIIYFMAFFAILYHPNPAKVFLERVNVFHQLTKKFPGKSGLPGN